jgi:hypothetical protein
MRDKFDAEVVQHLVANYYRTNRALRETCEALEAAGGTPWLFGGAVRDLAFARAPRDLDIVVTGPVEALEKVLATAKAGWKYVAGDCSGDPDPAEAVDELNDGRKTLARVEIDGQVVEIWHVSTQRGVKDLPPEEQTALAVARSTFLTVESILVHPNATPKDVEVADAGFIEFIRTAVVKCRPEWQDSINKAKFAVKALSVLMRVPNTILSPVLSLWVGEVLSMTDLPTFFRYQRLRLAGTEFKAIEPELVEHAMRFAHDPVYENARQEATKALAVHVSTHPLVGGPPASGV